MSWAQSEEAPAPEQAPEQAEGEAGQPEGTEEAPAPEAPDVPAEGPEAPAQEEQPEAPAEEAPPEQAVTPEAPAEEPAPEPEAPAPAPAPQPETGAAPAPEADQEGDHDEEHDEEEHAEEAHAGHGGHVSRATVGDPDRVRFSLPGEYAVRLTYQSNMELSAVPTDREDPEENVYSTNELGQNLYALHWFRIRPELSVFRVVRLVAQMDLLHGHIGGDDTLHVDAARDERAHMHGLGYEGVRARHLYLEWDTGYGILRAGQMGSNWGMGMLANDGDRGDGYLFGDHQHGDIVERIVFATKPFYTLLDNPLRELAVAVGGDLVYDDGMANLSEGDLAWQFVFALNWRLDPQRAIGLYIAYRNQTYDDGDTLEVTAIDLYAQWRLQLAQGVHGYAEVEIVGVAGSTNIAPNLYNEELDVRQLGAAGRLGVDIERIGLDVCVEGGFASGDADTNDDRVGRFSFDADYRVGLILFPELMGWSSARAATIAGEPELVGVAQDGVEQLPTNGGVSGAAYIYPSLRWRPLDWIDVRFAVLVAQATSDVISPFETKRRGTASSYRGAPASNRDLGVEIDLSFELRWDLDYVLLRGGVEAAYAIPGRAFDDADGNRHPDIGLVRTRLQLHW